jgi:hypothetical protein
MHGTLTLQGAGLMISTTHQLLRNTPLPRLSSGSVYFFSKTAGCSGLMRII